MYLTGSTARWLISGALAALLAVAPAAAQTNTGQISGTIRDSSGALIPGVAVTVTHAQTSVARADTTNGAGVYTVTALPVGTYSVSAVLEGFRKTEKSGIELTADGRITADFTLSVRPPRQIQLSLRITY